MSILSILSILMDISQKRTKNARKPMGPFKVPHVIIFCGCFSQVDEMRRNTRPTCSGLELRFFFFRILVAEFCGNPGILFFVGEIPPFFFCPKNFVGFPLDGMGRGGLFCLQLRLQPSHEVDKKVGNMSKHLEYIQIQPRDL